ncbi:MAG: hypothetical protein ACLF0G_05355 [Candidatus Brocadiia bacterium]
MARGHSPEEFFEVFREVLDGKKKLREKPAEEQGESQEAKSPQPPPPSPPEPEPQRRWRAQRAALADRVRVFLNDTVTVSKAVVVAAAVGTVLLVLAAFLLGRQVGWGRGAAATRQEMAGGPSARDQGGEEQGQGPSSHVIQLLSSDKLEYVELDVKRLNESDLFQARDLRAFVLPAPRQGLYRLCVSGPSDAALREVLPKIKQMPSHRGEKDFRQARITKP